MKIGIYDSGIGGLSVLHRALKKMPEAEFIYYADTTGIAARISVFLIILFIIFLLLYRKALEE